MNLNSFLVKAVDILYQPKNLYNYGGSLNADLFKFESWFLEVSRGSYKIFNKDSIVARIGLTNCQINTILIFSDELMKELEEDIRFYISKM